jgi:diguanylate cyclase (GGDEF)-like protein/PAS domain S-box-containing protein
MQPGGVARRTPRWLGRRADHSATIFATLELLANAARPASPGRLQTPARIVRLVAAMLVAAMWLLIVAGAVWSVLQGRAAALREAASGAANLAGAVAQQIAGRLDTVDIILTGLVERTEDTGLDPANVARLNQVAARRAATTFGVRVVGVTDDTGRWVATSARDRTADASVPAGPGFDYLRTHGDRGRVMGEPVRSTIDGHWVIGLMRRWNRPDGSFGGVAVGTIDLPVVEDAYARLDVGTQGVVCLLTTQGILAARFPPAPALVGQVLPEARALLAAGHSGAREIAGGPDRPARLYAYRPIEGYDLVQTVGLATDAVLAGWRRDARRTALMAVAFILAVSLFGARLVRDTRRRAAEHAAYRLLAENATDMIDCLDNAFVRRYVSPAARDLLGYQPDELIGIAPLAMVHPEDAAPLQAAYDDLLAGVDRRAITARMRHRDGSWIWMDVQLRRFVAPESGRPAGVIAAARDASARKAAEAAEAALQAANGRLAVLAHSDHLTGLANRRRFALQLQREASRACRDGSPLAIVMIDIDRFKLFNDRYGHPAGDRCLRAVAQAVAAAVQRPGDLAARYGGEELVVLLPATTLAGARVIAERIAEAVRARAIPHAGGIGGIVTVSIGVAAGVPDSAADADLLLAEADRALYGAKAAGRARVWVAGEAGVAPPPDCPTGPSEPTSGEVPPVAA